MKKRKTKIKILGEWIKIEYCSIEVMDGCWGDSDSQARVIRIEEGLDDAMYKRILSHETMHMKLGLSGISEHLTTETEESICVLMEST